MAKTTMTATFGEVVSTQVPFHSFRIGPYSLTVECEESEARAVLDHAMDVLRRQAMADYKVAREFWHNELRVERG